MNPSLPALALLSGALCLADPCPAQEAPAQASAYEATLAPEGSLERAGLKEGVASSDRPGSPRVQPAPLAGLWALSLGADFARLGSEDLASFYAPGTVERPPDRFFPGFHLQLRRHISEGFFGGATLASLPKGWTVDQPGSRDLVELDALLLGIHAGWMLYRGISVALYANAEAGWLVLSEGRFERTGLGATQGGFEGSALAEDLGGGGLWFVMPSVALELAGGWRFARLPLTFTTSKGQVDPVFAPEHYADFSGPYGRAGLSFFWGLRNPWGESEAPAPPSTPPPRE